MWFGRDVAFTYGPLYQWLSSAPSRWIGISTGTILATANMLPTMVSVLAIFASIRLLLPEVSPWKRALFLAVMFWSPPGIRLALCLLAFVIFVRLSDAAASRTAGFVRCPRWARPSSALRVFWCQQMPASMPRSAGAFSGGDRGRQRPKTPEPLSGLGAFLVGGEVCLAILVVATNAVMFAPLELFVLEIEPDSRHRLPLVRGQVDNGGLHLAAVGSAGPGRVVFGVAWRRREPEGNRWTLRPAFLLAGFCLAFSMMQSGLVRSDAIHVVNGIYPMVFLSGAILIGGLTNVRWWLSVMLVAVCRDDACL